MRRISTLVLALWYGLLATQAASAMEQLPRMLASPQTSSGSSCMRKACGCPLDEQRARRCCCAQRHHHGGSVVVDAWQAAQCQGHAQRQALHPEKIDPHLPLLSVSSLLPRPTLSSCDGRACRVLSGFVDPPDKIPV